MYANPLPIYIKIIAVDFALNCVKFDLKKNRNTKFYFKHLFVAIFY